MAITRNSLKNLEDYFTDRDSIVYFTKLVKTDTEVEDFLIKYFQKCTKLGVVISDGLQNPSVENLNFLQTKISKTYEHSESFIKSNLAKWLPRLSANQLNILSSNLFITLDDMKKSGKNDSVLNNTYLKLMCWLYFKFENITSKLGLYEIPKILYDGKLSNYDYAMLLLLSNCGCDILVLDYQNKFDYKELQSLEFGSKPFPSDFSVSNIKKKVVEKQKIIAVLGKPKYTVATNIWLSGNNKDEVKQTNRGSEPNYIYNALIRENGVSDKTTYKNEIYNLSKDIESTGRKVYIINGHLQSVSKADYNTFRRKESYIDKLDLITTLKDNIMLSSADLTILFNNILLEGVESLGNIPYSTIEGKLLNFLFNLKKYNSAFKLGQFGVFIIVQFEKFTSDDKFFVKFVSKLGADIIILNPNKVEDDLGLDELYEINYSDSYTLEKFPESLQEASYSTIAYNAETEIQDVLYGDESGLYKDMQFDKMQSVILKTTFEEIDLLWDEPLNMRTGFQTNNGVVTVPTIFAKVNGVKNDDKYLSTLINKLRSTENTIFIWQDNNLFRHYSNDDIVIENCLRAKNTLDFDKLKSCYYDYLREDIQYNIFNALQKIITDKIIVHENLAYEVLKVGLSLGNDITNMLQCFDYTKVNPKIVYLNTHQSQLSCSNSIFFSIMNILGFDIVMFIPTGYNVVGKFFNKKLYEEYTIGSYKTDFTLKSTSFFGKLFGR